MIWFHYRYLDTSLINVDVEANYIRVAVKGKIFQIVLSEEVNISEAIVKRSQITGQLVVCVPKLNVKKIFLTKTKKSIYNYRLQNINFHTNGDLSFNYRRIPIQYGKK